MIVSMDSEISFVFTYGKVRLRPVAAQPGSCSAAFGGGNAFRGCRAQNQTCSETSVSEQVY